MGKSVTKSGTCLFGALDLAANLREAGFDPSAEEVDVTNLASNGWKEFLQGIRSSDLSFPGFLEAAGSAGDPDATLESQFQAGTPVPALLALVRPPADGTVAWASEVTGFKLSNVVKIGEVWGFDLALKGNGAGVRGFILENVTRTSTGTSADSLTLPALGAGDRLYYFAQVRDPVAGTTPTLDLKIQSDADDGFASPTDRVTVAQFTAAGYVWGYISGAITDVEWRVSATVGGTGGPSFPYTVFIGISAASE